MFLSYSMSEEIDVNMEIMVAVKDPNNSQGWDWVTVREGRVVKFFVRDIGRGNALLLSYIFEDGKGGLVVDLSKITSMIRHSTGIYIEGPTPSLALKENNKIKRLNGLKYRIALYGDIADKIQEATGIKATL